MSRTMVIAGACLMATLWGCGTKDGSTQEVSPYSGAVDGGAGGWTLLFYLAADNAQEAAADVTLKQLQAATAQGANTQVIVLLDRLSQPGTEVYEVSAGKLVQLQTHPEEATSSGAVLQAFATFGLQRATYDNVAFVIKSEGLSWRGIGRDNTHAPDSPDTLMSCGDLAQGLIAAQSAADKDVDLLVLEGSIMAFVEVVYELRDAAPILLASQSKIQPDGLPWALVIDDLEQHPAMSGQDLGIAIADDLQAYYGVKGNKGVPAADTSTNFAAMTVFDTSFAVQALAAHGAWAKTTWPLLDTLYNVLPHARDLSDVGGFGDVTDVDFQSDIKTFMVESKRLIAQAGLSLPAYDAAVDAYLAVQDDLVVYQRKPSDGSKLGSANGVSIWFPPTWSQYDTSDLQDGLFGSSVSYEDPTVDLDWVNDSNWVTFLKAYFDRADANLAGNGASSDEPPKPGVFDNPGKKQ